MRPGRPATDLTHKTFGFLTVLGLASRTKRESYWKCRCICGTDVTRPRSIIVGGRGGCPTCQPPVGRPRALSDKQKQSRLKHIESSWRNMIRRCKDKRHDGFANYGGRGITVCDEWKDKRAFIRDMQASWFFGACLERKNNDGDYTPSNCVWSTPKTQSANKRNTIKGRIGERSMTISQALFFFGNPCSYGLAKKRIAQGWDFIKAVSSPAAVHLQWHSDHPEHERVIAEFKALYYKQAPLIGISKKRIAALAGIQYGTLLAILNNRVRISELTNLRTALSVLKAQLRAFVLELGPLVQEG